MGAPALAILALEKADPAGRLHSARRLALSACAVGWLCTFSASAQEQGEPRSVPLRELPPARELLLRAERECFDEASWRQRLLQADLERRELAFEELLALMVRCGQARRAVEGWAGGAEPELGWSARLALRELRLRMPAGWSAEPGFLPSRTVLSDPGEPPLGSRLRHFHGLPEGLFAQGGSLLSLHRPRVFRLPVESAASDARAYRLRMKAEGVELEILQSGPQGESRRSFRAPSLAELLGEHPELLGELPELQAWSAERSPDGALSLQWNRSRVRLSLDPFAQPASPRSLALGGEPLLGEASAGLLLGVECEPLGSAEARRLGVEPGLGLLVERIYPGSIAMRLDLRRGDVLLALNGAPLRCTADLRSALKAVEPGSGLLLQFLDRDGQSRTLRWEP
jgi:hypothetical protein